MENLYSSAPAFNSTSFRTTVEDFFPVVATHSKKQGSEGSSKMRSPSVQIYAKQFLSLTCKFSDWCESDVKFLILPSHFQQSSTKDKTKMSVLAKEAVQSFRRNVPRAARNWSRPLPAINVSFKRFFVPFFGPIPPSRDTSS
jgi:hypothetical protein